MTDLWMILVLLGASIVLAVVVFNWWQEKKYRKDVEYRFSHTRADVLDGNADDSKNAAKKKTDTDKNPASEDVEGWMSEPRVRQTAKFEPDFKVADQSKDKSGAAPHLTTDPEKQPGKNAPSGQLKTQPSTSAQQTAAKYAQEPVLPLVDQPLATTSAALADAPAPSAETSTVGVSKAALPAALHSAMDWIGVIEAPLGVMLAELEEMQAEVRTFPHHATLWGQRVAETDWLDVLAMDTAAMQDQTPLGEVVCSLQLADRGGPVSEETLARFQKSMETLARALGLSVAWQGGYQASQQAQAIDAFCIEVDKAVEFHVLANQGMFHATKLRGLAEASGMQLSADGRFELFNPEGQLEFSIRNYEGKPFSAEMLKSTVMTGVTFQLDIPTTANSLQVFDHMVELASGMASSLGGGLIDVNRKPIGDAQLSKIRQQLSNISNAMATQGIVPGSGHAKRLFS